MGIVLAPPLDAKHSLGPLVPTPLVVEGTNWKQSSIDIAVAGLGWIAVGVGGRAEFNVWTHAGAKLLQIARYHSLQDGEKRSRAKHTITASCCRKLEASAADRSCC